MKFLSIRQPWAYFIVAGHKDVENRVWSMRYRGPILIHASQKLDRIPDSRKLCRLGVAGPTVADLLRGGIVGMAEIVDCVERSDSPWYIRGQFGIVLDTGNENNTTVRMTTGRRVLGRWGPGHSPL